MGLCNTFTGIFIIYSAFLSRVNGPLQSILIQLIFPVGLVLSKIILKKKYNKSQYIEILLVSIGIITSLIPLTLMYLPISYPRPFFAVQDKAITVYQTPCT